MIILWALQFIKLSKKFSLEKINLFFKKVKYIFIDLIQNQIKIIKVLKIR
jgi:hypothetical protein